MKYTTVTCDALSDMNKFMYRDEKGALILENKKCFVRYTQKYSFISVQENKNSGSCFTIKPTRKKAYDLWDELMKSFDKKTTLADVLEVMEKYGRAKKYYNFH